MADVPFRALSNLIVYDSISKLQNLLVVRRMLNALEYVLNYTGDSIATCHVANAARSESVCFHAPS